MSKVILFAGHYPENPGAAWDGLSEHEEAVRWCDLLREHMDEAELLIGPTGRLREKTRFVNLRWPVLAVDLHFNAWRDEQGKPRGEGSMTLYCPGSVKGELAAKFVQDELAQVFEPDLGVREGYYQLNSEKGPDWFLVRTKCPALIVEPEYVHHGDKLRDLRAEGVDALARGLRAAVGALRATA